LDVVGLVEGARGLVGLVFGCPFGLLEDMVEHVDVVDVATRFGVSIFGSSPVSCCRAARRSLSNSSRFLMSVSSQSAIFFFSLLWSGNEPKPETSFGQSQGDKNFTHFGFGLLRGKDADLRFGKEILYT
jgi:hypothetical protein